MRGMALQVTPKGTPSNSLGSYAMFAHYIDLLPFVLGTFILVVGAATLSAKKPLGVLIVATTAIYLLAQSSWFSSFMAGDNWGRDWANYIWFLFNSLTMVIFSWTLLLLRSK
jgi:hypothetical protein